MSYIEIIGAIGATLTTSSLLPQTIKLYKTKSAKDLSLWTYVVLAVGTLLWVIYGVLLKQPPIYIANIICFLLASIILFLKFKHD